MSSDADDLLRRLNLFSAYTHNKWGDGTHSVSIEVGVTLWATGHGPTFELAATDAIARITKTTP